MAYPQNYHICKISLQLITDLSFLPQFITESVPKKIKHDDTSAHKERGISKAVKS